MSERIAIPTVASLPSTCWIGQLVYLSTGDKGLYYASALNTWVYVAQEGVTGGSGVWGAITGTLSAQTDLQNALNAKAATSHAHAPGDVTGTAVITNDARLSDARTPTAHTHSYQPLGFTVLGNDTLAQALATNINTKLTVTAARTLTTTVPAAGTRCAVLILTSGTTSYVVTFGTGFKPTGTLATGTTSARIFVVNFISDGTNLYEAGRTAAMVA